MKAGRKIAQFLRLSGLVRQCNAVSTCYANCDDGGLELSLVPIK